jgi:NTP pyrophosphatase (non-canonical NTP hydrolase)
MKGESRMEKITKDQETLICKRAIDTFGAAIQQVVAMEECGELIQAISKAIRCKTHNVEEEIADVEIMCKQLRIIYNSQKVDEIKQDKLKRLEGVVWNGQSRKQKNEEAH